MTRRNGKNCRTHALTHKFLGHGRNHLVFGRYEIPRRNALPCCRTSLICETRHAQRLLHGGHNGSLLLIDVGSKCCAEARLVDPQEAIVVGPDLSSARRGGPLLAQAVQALALINSE